MILISQSRCDCFDKFNTLIVIKIYIKNKKTIISHRTQCITNGYTVYETSYLFYHDIIIFHFGPYRSVIIIIL